VKRSRRLVQTEAHLSVRCLPQQLTTYVTYRRQLHGQLSHGFAASLSHDPLLGGPKTPRAESGGPKTVQCGFRWTGSERLSLTYLFGHVTSPEIEKFAQIKVVLSKTAYRLIRPVPPPYGRRHFAMLRFVRDVRLSLSWG